jgi:hypothetical protein
MEIWVGIVSVLVGAVAGTVGTLITTKNKMRLEHQLAYDRELRNLRLPHYQGLYHVSRCIPRQWTIGEEPARPALPALREIFHDWYFGQEAGGLFLTTKAREKYFRLQNELQAIAGRGPDQSQQMSTEESITLRALARELRHQLVEDLGTAEPPQLRWTPVGPTPPPPASKP